MQKVLKFFMLLIIGFSLLALVSGCGQRGPLYLPKAEVPKASM